MATTNADFKVKKGLQVEGGDIHLGTGQDGSLSTDNRTGTNVAGRHLTITAGTGTGNEGGGRLDFYTGGAAGNSGSSASTSTLALRLDKDGTANFQSKNLDGIASISADSTSGLVLDLSDGNTGTNAISLRDDMASALDIKQGLSDSYMTFVTTDNSEQIDLKKPTTIVGSAANQNVTVIKTTDAASTSGNAFDIQWHNGSAYASAFKVSAQYGRIGIGTTPDTTVGASAYKVKIGGNANVAGTVNATGNLTVTGTGSTGGDFTATGNGKPVKLRMSDGFPDGGSASTHPISDYNSENFYSSMSYTETISAGGSIAPGTIRSIGYVNMAGSKDKFQVVEVFASVSIKNSSSNEITKRLTEKFYGIFDNGVVETVREWSQGDTSLGQFQCVLESDGDGSSNAAMEIIFRYTHHSSVDSSNAEDMKIAVNINGLSIHGTPPS